MGLPLLPLALGALMAPGAVKDTIGLAEDLGFDPVHHKRRRRIGYEDTLRALLMDDLQDNEGMAEEEHLNTFLRGLPTFETPGHSGMGDLHENQFLNELTMANQKQLAELSRQENRTRSLEEMALQLGITPV